MSTVCASAGCQAPTRVTEDVARSGAKTTYTDLLKTFGCLYGSNDSALTKNQHLRVIPSRGDFLGITASLLTPCEPLSEAYMLLRYSESVRVLIQ